MGILKTGSFEPNGDFCYNVYNIFQTHMSDKIESQQESPSSNFHEQLNALRKKIDNDDVIFASDLLDIQNLTKERGVSGNEQKEAYDLLLNVRQDYDAFEKELLAKNQHKFLHEIRDVLFSVIERESPQYATSLKKTEVKSGKVLSIYELTAAYRRMRMNREAPTLRKLEGPDGQIDANQWLLEDSRALVTQLGFRRQDMTEAAFNAQFAGAPKAKAVERKE